MTRSTRTSRILSASLALLVGVGLSAVAELRAQDGPYDSSLTSSPLGTEDNEAIQRALETEGVVRYARRRVDEAARRAVDTLGCTLLDHGLASARQAFERRAYRRTDSLLRSLLDRAPSARCEHVPHADASNKRRGRPSFPSGALRTPSPGRSETLEMARLLRGHALLELDRPRRALDLFDDVDSTPIGDYVDWLKASAHAEAGEHARAASAYGRIYEQHASSPLRFRARARQTLALVEAEQWREALPLLEQMLETFPDYPRRSRLLFERGRTLEHLGRFRDAARSYRDAWLEFPHKPNGDRALARLDLLRRRGVDVAEPSNETLFEHYHELRQHKHWQLAETLLLDLLETVRREGNTELEHRILMQLGLNAYIPKHNEEALRYFRDLHRAYRSGHRAGIDISSVREYLGRTYARLGDMERAVEHLERAFQSEGVYERKREMAEFFMGFGQYERARKLFDSYYSEWRKRRWTYSWLLYKTERFEEAYDHFTHIARNHHGRREARGLYWAARTREHQGEPAEAKAYFKRIAEEFAHTYYGFQAENRLLDLRQRSSVGGGVAQRTRSLIDASDQVLRALDEAGDALEGRSSLGAIDPTLVPKPAPPERAAVPGDDPVSHCRPGRGGDRQFCHLLSGRIPDPTLRIIQRALSPRYAPRALLSGGLHAFHIRPPRDPLRSSGSSSAAPPLESGGESKDEATPRASEHSTLSWHTEARIYWEGRFDSEMAFVRYANGEAIGPVPDAPRAYDTSRHVGGLDRAVRAAGDLFPELERARWLRNAGLTGGARDAIRDVALEFEAVTKRGAPSDGEPHELPHERWTYLIDHRRGHQGYWGYRGEEVPRYPVPDETDEKRALAERQQTIAEREGMLRSLLLDAMMEVGDYHLVRQFTLEHGGNWYERSPSGPAHDEWTQAYPRAFPRMVLSEAREHGINPYLIWSLMAVESAYNPDSVSYADAIGLLQVIPRTGIKVAEWLGDEDFSPYDLIEPDVAIRQGTSYFSSLVKKFHRQELFAVAGYNGGPHRVALWLDRRGEMPLDEFVEEIPFTQTRRYVKKVTRYLGIYMRLYEDRDALYIGQNIDPTYRPEPNF